MRLEGKISLENGEEIMFFLNGEDVEILQQGVDDMKKYYAEEGYVGEYSILNELRYAISNYIDRKKLEQR